MAKKKKEKEEKIDGLNPKDIAKIRAAIRQVWSWSHPRRLCLARATDKETGFGTCEMCGETVAKLYVDHKQVMGDVLAPDYIRRMWAPSAELQALCKKCHQKKTNEEKKALKEERPTL